MYVVGSWGYEPADSDASSDLYCACEEAVRKTLIREFSKKYKANSFLQWRFDRVGMMQRALQAGVQVPRVVYEQALADLLACERDADWVASWKSPMAAKKARAQFRRALLKLDDSEADRALAALAGHRPRRLIWAPRGWPHKHYNLRKAREAARRMRRRNRSL